ncbi:hypothetical protein OUZ56_004346 [Daphnia magna]|uniref:Uncharacterized protein n=1 Tax=Daphnia magna TaxID=35525 RepID=A0ABQ9YPG6_9CRUS|nr:hypothetical protein OUZ56_004346 [Daphnia magna]
MLKAVTEIRQYLPVVSWFSGNRALKVSSGIWMASVLENPGYPRIVAKNSRTWAIRVAYLPKWVGWADLMGKSGIPTTILENGGLQSTKLN